MAITAQQVKELREMTGAGMMDCKKALQENDGDMDAAVEYLQLKGMAAAAKKAGRTAAEGLVQDWISADGHEGVLVEVNSETDFVARNENFQNFVQEVAAVIGNSQATTLEEAQALQIKGKTLADYTAETIATIGENIQVRRFTRFSEPEGVVTSYIHAGSQIGVLIKAKLDGELTDEKGQFVNDVAMHVAAMNPGYLTMDDIDADVAAKQEELFTGQVKEEGKPDKIIPRIVEGKMGKWRKEQALLEQPFVKDSDTTVGQLQSKVGGVQLTGFVRFEVGEGIEKQESNLADEVAAQLKG